jgi:molybdopterin-containing oxidoreductase family membrane subunit
MAHMANTATLPTITKPLAQELNPSLVAGNLTYHDVTNQVCEIVEGKVHRNWYIGFAISFSIFLMMVGMLGYQLFTGVGVWGNNAPVAWAWDITNFVFWIGIGHAGTLISAVLFLFRQKWRTSINRAAEAMTLFAVACAAIYPVMHTGRPWRTYWLFPVPNVDLNMWQNFRSPLMWDVFAISTYGSVSAVFWYMGLIPDLATIRDRAAVAGDRTRATLYGIFSLGWRFSARHWTNYEKMYLLLAAISTPLVLSVHSIVSFDFATSVIPGWHTTIFPPYFVAGAVFSGFAMVQTLMLVTRWALGLENLITPKHLDNMNKIILATGMIVGYAYATEFFIAWYSANQYERFVFFNRAFGPYWWAYATMVSCNVISPQIFWVKSLRTNVKVTFVMSIFVNIGMWFERFVIIASSLHRDFIPSSWGYFKPSYVDICTFIGTFGFFMTLFLLFLRFIPCIALSEVKGAMAAQAHLPGHDPVKGTTPVHAGGHH